MDCALRQHANINTPYTIITHLHTCIQKPSFRIVTSFRGDGVKRSIQFFICIEYMAFDSDEIVLDLTQFSLLTSFPTIVHIWPKNKQKHQRLNTLAWLFVSLHITIIQLISYCNQKNMFYSIFAMIKKMQSVKQTWRWNYWLISFCLLLSALFEICPKNMIDKH